MNILVFRLTDADGTWYVWSGTSPRLYSFRSKTEAQHFADELSQTHGGTPVRIERSIEQIAALI